MKRFLAFAILIMASASDAQAAVASTYECESGGSLCIMIPGERVELPQKRGERTPNVEVRSSTLLSKADLQGGAASMENEYALETSLGDRTLAPSDDINAEPLAFADALRTIEQVRAIDLFLKSGVGSQSDLRVITSSKPQR